MAGVITLLDQPRTLNAQGKPTSAVIFFYLTGTTVLADIYNDAALTNPADNPVLLASGGIFPDIYLDPEIIYRRRIVYGDGTIHDVDPFISGGGSADSSGYLPGGTGAVETTVQERLRREVWVEDFMELPAVGDQADAFNKAIAAVVAVGGGTVNFTGQYEVGSTLTIPSGVSLKGSGASYYYLGSNLFFGSWINYTGAAPNPALRYFSVQGCEASGFGISCGEVASSVAISIGSNNNPSTQSLYFHNFIVFGAALAVKWGDANVHTALEQCDDISFRDYSFHSCVDGFRLEANNIADTSLIERGRLYQMQGLCFDLRNYGILRISECQAGLLNASSRMFKIGGASPDQLAIQLCQSEGPAGKFLEIGGNNDQGAVHLSKCVINQPVAVAGIVRVTSEGCYINSVIDLDGYVRWTSTLDVWDGPLETAQVTVANGARFDAIVQRDANGQNGVWLPVGMKIQNTLTAGGYEYLGSVRAGINGRAFVPSAGPDYYYVGSYFLPTTDNGFAYKVTVAGTAAGTEPTWPTTISSTVVSGGVTFQCIGAGALMKGVGAIQA